MTHPPLVERLRALPNLADVPDDQLGWLVRHGEYRRAEDGEEIRASDDGVGLSLVISGRFSIRVDQGGVIREVREVTEGRATGFLPYSRMKVARGYLVADGPVEYLEIARTDIREMTRNCYDFTALCVHEMLDRVAVFKSDDKHQEKMAALGRLSAGLAHELNNPASAVARAAGELEASRAEVAAAARALGALDLDVAASASLEALEARARNASRDRSALARADAEDRMAQWLEERGIDAAPAYPLAEAGLDVADLEQAAGGLDGTRLGPALRYVAADVAARELAVTIGSAAARIHSLVAAVKKHTHMDRAPAREPIPLAGHLSDAIELMTAKAAEKGVSLDLSLDADQPVVDGSVADLNQVWMHLLDNAIDAAAEEGRVLVSVDRQDGVVVVRVVDDGPGVPSEHREKIFEPFFTTKDVGQGRGLGLDIVRTVVRSHRGVVDLTSEPGRTEFRVSLPASAESTGGRVA